MGLPAPQGSFQQGGLLAWVSRERHQDAEEWGASTLAHRTAHADVFREKSIGSTGPTGVWHGRSSVSGGEVRARGVADAAGSCPLSATLGYILTLPWLGRCSPWPQPFWAQVSSSTLLDCWIQEFLGLPRRYRMWSMTFLKPHSKLTP